MGLLLDQIQLDLPPQMQTNCFLQVADGFVQGFALGHNGDFHTLCDV